MCWADGPPTAWTCKGNHKGALEPVEHHKFLRAELRELLEMGAVRIVKEKPHLVSPFNVVPKATKGKFRLILDLRKLNEALREWKFKMETLQTHREILRKGRWAVGRQLGLRAAADNKSTPRRRRPQPAAGAKFFGVRVL